MFKKVSNHRDYRSNKKLPITSNESPSKSSTSSSTDSIISEYVVNPSPVPSTKNKKSHQSIATIEIRPIKQQDDEPIYANHRSTIIDDFRTIPHRPLPTRRLKIETNPHKNSDPDSIGPELQKFTYRTSITSNNYETTEIESSQQTPPPIPPPPPAFAKPYLYNTQRTTPSSPPYPTKRTLPLAIFMMELGSLIIVFIVCMVLVVALRENEIKLQIVYAYIYIISIIWMIWCTFDIIKFRRQWLNITSEAEDLDEYMDISERHPHVMFYFPDNHNTGGLFMRVGAGLLCMGGLLLTLIEIVKTIANVGNDDTKSDLLHTSSTGKTYSLSVLITKMITYIFRFIFHCVQFSFLFRYGNIVINRYHLLAKIGLIHLIIANFCTWFEAIIIETLAQIDKSRDTTPSNSTLTVTATKNQTVLQVLEEIESKMGVYLYPCLIEYSLISVTVFFIMWKNVGKIKKKSLLRFGDRHIFTINCSRSSRGLLIGGILFLLTILTLIPTYIFEDDSATLTHITGVCLLIVSLLTVLFAYFDTTKLFYDEHAHVDRFDQVLILITTIGDFAYSFFSLFAFIFISQSESKLPTGVEICTTIFAICQTFIQTGFIMDTLKRRIKTKQENRIKPGRETITTLLLLNLAIWLHDSLSAKKFRSNPTQLVYYNTDTWAIIQAFTSPLSIFYRFHSSVCLADIWQEVYQHNSHSKQRMIPLTTINNGLDSHH